MKSFQVVFCVKVLLQFQIRKYWLGICKKVSLFEKRSLLLSLSLSCSRTRSCSKWTTQVTQLQADVLFDATFASCTLLLSRSSLTFFKKHFFAKNIIDKKKLFYKRLTFLITITINTSKENFEIKFNWLKIWRKYFDLYSG